MYLRAEQVADYKCLICYASMVMPQIQQFIQITQVSALAISSKR